MGATEHRCTIRGTAAACLLGFLRQEFGDASLDRIAAALAPAHRALLSTELLLGAPVEERSVLPVELVVDVLGRAGEMYCADSGGALALAEGVGAHAAREDRSLLRRLGIEGLAAEHVVRAAPRLWKEYASCGTLTPTEVDSHSFLLSLEGFHDAHPAWCRCLTGYLREVVRRASGRQARVVEVQCVSEGAPVCEWHGDWNAASLF